jgi:hypothetical protein
MIDLQGKYGLYSSLTRNRVQCTFSITQRHIDKSTQESCVPFMLEIANIFQCNINYKPNNKIGFFVKANSKHYLVKSYFNNYPLLTSKYLDYLCFLQGLDYLGKELTYKEILAIQNIKNNMNNKRYIFN